MALPWLRNQQKSSTMARVGARFKRSMRVELAVDALEIANQVDSIMLFSGDGDFLLATRSRATPRCPRHRHFQFAEQTTDDRRRIATPSGYFRRTRRSKGSHWSNVEHCSAAGRVRLVARRTPKARRCPGTWARGLVWGQFQTSRSEER